jgi:hypothetical protein
VNQPPSIPQKRHSFQALIFAPPQGHDALPPTVRTPPPAPRPYTPVGHLALPEAELARDAGNNSARALTSRSRSRSANDSHVRLRAVLAPPAPAADHDFRDAQELLDELCEDQLTMSMNLACLEEGVGQAPRDASAHAAVRTLSARLADLGALRDALASVQVAMVDPRLQRLAIPDSPLADYLRGLYAWGHAVVRALDHLAGSLRKLQPDWALVRWRIEEAKNFHFDELHAPIRAELEALTIMANSGPFGARRPPVEDLAYAVERLFATAVALEEHLDERFG